MNERLIQLLSEELITPNEAIDVEFAVCVGDASEQAALRTLDRIESIRSKVVPHRFGYDVVAVLGQNVRGSGRVIRTLSI